MLRLLRAALIALLVIASGAAEAARDRNRLWPVVRTCVAAYRLTRIPFPCLQVRLPHGRSDRGYAVLRPFRRQALILAPTRRIPGVEDPFLQSPEAPNYFASAWRARTFLKGPDGNPPARDQIALIVNAEGRRSQDQLHIHIGCLRPDARRFLSETAGDMPLNTWTRVGPMVPGQIYYGERVRQTDFERSNPFRMAVQGFEGAAEHPGRLMVMTVGARVEGEDDFLVVAIFGGVSGAIRHSSAESLLDRSCTAPSPLGSIATAGLRSPPML